jgi:N-acetylglucosaminyl-diphospho-decaprenol L-rhamnosyltransferase
MPSQQEDEKNGLGYFFKKNSTRPKSDCGYRDIAVSIVSHRHGAMVEPLVGDLLECPQIGQIILTRNIPESQILPQDTRLMTIDNAIPSGFAANHNEAFKHCRLPYFCALNPDIRLQDNPFPSLRTAIREMGATIVGPLVRNLSGGVEDSMRPFPSICSLLSKILGLSNNHYKITDYLSVFYPEWVAGMFMFFTSVDFRRLGGFDEHFFLYYEDVDICARAWKAGMRVMACPSVSVIHDAQRASHRNISYMRWHFSSMILYFLKHWGRLPSVREQVKP